MAIATTSVTLTTTGWTLLADGKSQVLIQSDTVGSVTIYAGTEAPSDATTVGVEIADGQAFAATGTTTGDKFYGRSLSGESEVVTVMAL